MTSPADPTPEQSRISEITEHHDACIASGDDLCHVPWLLATLAALEQERDAWMAQALAAGEGVLIDAPALAVRERERAEASERERDALRAELEAWRASRADGEGSGDV